MAAASAQAKTIRVAVDSSQAVSNVHHLHNAFTQLTGSNPGLAALVQQLQALQNAASGAGGAGGAGGGSGGGAGGAARQFGFMGSAAQAAMQRLSGLTGSMGGVATAGAALGVTAVAGGLVALGTAAVRASAQFEAYKASLTTVLGSTEKAGQAFDKLTQFAAKTPFSLDQSVQGFIKLKALGLQPSEAAMMSYGNTASAMGKDLNQMVEAVADAATGEFERLKEFGIKASKSGNDVAFTFQGVTKKVGNNASDIQKYLLSIGEVNFAGAMARQMDTFNGAMSNLEDTWTQTMAAVGDGGLTKSVAGIVNMITSGLTTITPILVAIGNAMSGIISGVGSILTGIGSMFGAISTGGGTTGGILEALTFQFNMIGQVAQVVGALIGGVMSAIGGVISGVADLLVSAFGPALSWLGVSFESGSRSWGNSIFGILRAVKAVAMAIPQVFGVVVNDVMRMFRDLGNAIAALLSGNWKEAAALANKTQFANTGKALSAVGRIGVATYRDQAGADAAMNRMLGRSAKNTGGPSLADLAGAAPKVTPAGADKDDAAKKAAAKAKAENDFWKTLQNELATAQLFGIEAAKLSKEKEYQRVLERDLSAAEKSRVDTMVQDIANAKALTDLKQASFDLENKAAVARMRSLGLSEEQAAIQDAIDAKMLAALASGVAMGTILGANYQTELARYRTLLEQNQAIDRQRDLLKGALDAARSMEGVSYGAGFDVKKIDDQKAAFLNAFNNGELKDAWGNPMSEAMFAGISEGMDKARREALLKPFQFAVGFTNDALKSDGSVKQQQEEAKRQFRDTMEALDKAKDAGAITAEGFRVASYKAGQDLQRTFDEIGTEFARKLNTVTGILARVGDMIGGRLGEALGRTADVGNAFNDFAKTKGDISSSITQAFGKDSAAVKGIGKAVGGAVAGMEIGTQIAGLTKAIGIKTSTTGAQIGGAVGGAFFGPIGSAVGGLLGGIVGGMFKKSPKGSISITGADTSSYSGSGKLAEGLKGAGTGLQSTLQNIAKSLGGAVGAFGVAIGKNGDWFHVSGDPNADVSAKHPKSALIYEGKDEAEAIAAALKNAIQDGAITGISDFAKRALNALDADAAISLVQSFKGVTDELDAMVDPIGAAVRGINDPLNSLVTQMQAVGASSTDLAKIEEYRTKKLDRALKDQLSSINDFVKTLSGANSGVSDYDRLTKSLTEFDTMKAQIASGDKSLDQSTFTALGQEIFSLAQAVYGTSTSQFQDIRSMLTMTSTSFADAITKSFNSADANASTVTAIDATTAAINAQTNALVAQQTLMTSYLKTIADNSASNDNAVDQYGGTVSYNGTYSGSTY